MAGRRADVESTPGCPPPGRDDRRRIEIGSLSAATAAATATPRLPADASRLSRRAAAVVLGALSWFCLLVAGAGAEAQMTGFLAAPTDQLAVPGDLAGGEITPEGDLYTGWAEYELSFGTKLRPWYQPTRTLPVPSVPLFLSGLHDGQVTYTQQLFAVSVDGAPVAYMTLTAHNGAQGARTARAQLAVAYTRGGLVMGLHGVMTARFRYERPVAPSAAGLFTQPGVAFSAAWRYSRLGRDIVRDGLLLARGPQAPSRAVLLASAAATAPGVRETFDQRLAAGQSVSWTWQVPLQAAADGAGVDRRLDAMPLQTARAALFSLWREQEAGMTQISVPEARVNAVYQANAMEMLASRYRTPSGWVQTSNKLQYQAYWIRDSAIETNALDQINLHEAAAQNLAFLAHWQQPDGLYISRSGQQDGVGQALWELSEHAQLTQSPAFAARELASVGAAVNWIDSSMQLDALGILPPSDAGDDEFAAGYLTGDNLWAAVGLREAVRLATLAGRPDLADAWQAVDTHFEADLDEALAIAYASSGRISPLLDSAAGFDWGNYGAAYPLPIVAPDSPLVAATIAWANAHSQEGLVTYDDGSTLHDYLGFKIYEAELDAGSVAAALSGFYAELVHTTSTGGGWEEGIAPWGSRENALILAPHGTFAGEYVTMLRNLLVRDDGPSIDLLGGVSPAWMAAGDRISVTNAPTHHGNISFTAIATRSGATLRWSSDLPPGTPLDWKLPYWVPDARTPAGVSVTDDLPLRTPSGTAQLQWSAPAPDQSYAQTVSALNAGYRAHGQPAPIVPALD